MIITLKLYATLGEYLPPQAKKTQMSLEITATTTVQEVIEQFNIPNELAHLVLVNGIYTAPEDRAATVLSDQDVLAIWPPVAGG